MRLAIVSDDGDRLKRFLSHYGDYHAYFYHEALTAVPVDHQERIVWTGYHAAMLIAVTQEKWHMVNDLFQSLEWPLHMPDNDPFLFIYWKAVQTIDHCKCLGMYRTLYVGIMDCITYAMQSVFTLDIAFIRGIDLLNKIKGYAQFQFPNTLLKTLESINDTVCMYKDHLCIKGDDEHGESCRIQLWFYKPLNDRLANIYESLNDFCCYYNRVTPKKKHTSGYVSKAAGLSMS